MGTKIFDKGMMTYQHAYGRPYTIPIYCWYLEGGDKKILVDTGEMSPIRSEGREKAIGGKIYDFEEMEVIPPGTSVNVYEAYDCLLRVKSMADILLPLHEPKFASIGTIPNG